MVVKARQGVSSQQALTINPFSGALCDQTSIVIVIVTKKIASQFRPRFGYVFHIEIPVLFFKNSVTTSGT
jgi:hypothetical protein